MLRDDPFLSASEADGVVRSVRGTRYLPRIARQVTVVLIAWGFLVSLQTNNDGLWFQGDSSRHALNGVFWKDILARLPADPQAFAFRYFAHYPAINPATYPPFFYLVEALFFAVVGTSPFVAKAAVLNFTLVTALYALLWLRRWVAPAAGYFAAVVPVLPGIVLWSHAIMLNVPACAMTLASLYHTRRWLEEPRSWHFFAAACLSVLAVLTYYQAAIVVLVIVAWTLATGQWRLLFRSRTLVTAAICGTILLPAFFLAVRWAPGNVEMLAPSARLVSTTSEWLFYLRPARDIMGPGLLLLAGLGSIAGLLTRRWRLETTMQLIWIASTYGFLTFLMAKDSRYMLPVAPALVFLSAIGLAVIGSVLHRSPGRGEPTVVIVTAALGLLLALGARAWIQPYPAVGGLSEVARFLDGRAPDENVFYDGAYHGTFTFYARIGDPEMRRTVVRGNKLLYLDAHTELRTPLSFVSSAQDVVEVLRTRSGCRWLAIEQGTKPAPTPAYQYLREAVQGPLFKRERSFPITGSRGTSRVDLYQFQSAIVKPTDMEIPLPLAGNDAWLKVQIRPDDRGALPNRRH